MPVGSTDKGLIQQIIYKVKNFSAHWNRPINDEKCVSTSLSNSESVILFIGKCQYKPVCMVMSYDNSDKKIKKMKKMLPYSVWKVY